MSEVSNIHKNSPLALGTAQLGMHYGIANKAGQPDQETVTKIVRSSWECGIREFDTAQGYGDSEQVLGKAMQELQITGQAKIITKLHPETDYSNAETVKKSIRESIKRLGVSKIHGIMLHRETLLDQWQMGIGDICRSIVKEGLADHIGISVYSPEKALAAMEFEEISMIQLPANILDARFNHAGVFALAAKLEKKIYIRSIFLQGLLLLDVEEIPGKIAFAKPEIQKVENLTQELSLSRVKLAIGYLMAKYPQATLLFGAETPNQVKDTANNARHALTHEIVESIDSHIGKVSELVIRPDRWPQ